MSGLPRLNLAVHRHCCRGLTLVELLLALSITSTIGLGVASMLTAVSYGTQAEYDQRRLLVTRKVIVERFGQTVRGSQRLLDAGDDWVVIWLDDTDGSGTINTGEVRRIGFDTVANTIVAYEPDTDALGNSTHELTDDFESLTDDWIADGDVTVSTWAQGISALSIAMKDPDPQAALLLTYRLTIGSGVLSETIAHAVDLPGPE